MNTLEKISCILGAEFKPSTKIGLITLIVEDRPLTTAELNNLLNLNKTFENYKVLFDEQINDGFIKLVPLKTASGYTRFHFELDGAALINSI